MPGGGALKGGYRLAQDELLLLKDSFERIHQLPVKRAVLALQVQHGDGLGGWGRGPSRIAGSGGSVFHLTILPAAQGFLASPEGICVSRLLLQTVSGK
jgi:hypothetical protein